METIITIANLSDVERGAFIIIYEDEKPIDSGIILEIRKSQNVILFESASKKEQAILSFISSNDYNVWFPAFEGPNHKLCYSRRGSCYSLRETDRRIPLRLQ